MSLDLSQYLSMKARDAAEEECSRLRAEVARLTGELAEAREIIATKNRHEIAAEALAQSAEADGRRP